MSKICKKRVHGNDKKNYLETLKSVLGRSILGYCSNSNVCAKVVCEEDTVTACEL